VKHAQDTHALGSPFKSSQYAPRASLTGPAGPLFEPECFNMIVTSEDKEDVYPITAFDRTAPRMQDLAVDPQHLTKREANAWAPLLSTMQDGSGTFASGGPADCQMLYIESSLALMDDVPRGSSLTISFFVGCHDRPGAVPGAASIMLERDWAGFEVRSAFYEDGAFLEGLVDKPVAYDPRACSLEVPLGAEFWARRIMQVASARRHAVAAAAGAGRGADGSPGVGYAEARARLARLSAVQTVYARPRAAVPAPATGFAQPQPQRVRLLVMFWRFDLAAPGTLGSTSWSNVAVQPSMPLSSAGAAPHSMLALVAPGQASPLVGFTTMPAGGMGIGAFGDGQQARAPLFALPSSAAVQNSSAHSVAVAQQRQMQYAAATTACSPAGLFAPAVPVGLHHMLQQQQQHQPRHTPMSLGYLRGGPSTVVTTCGPAGGGIVAMPPPSGGGVGLFESGAHGPVGVLDHGMFETPPTDEGTPWSAHGAYGEYYGAAGADGIAAAHGAGVNEMGVYGGAPEFDDDEEHRHHHLHHQNGGKKIMVDDDHHHKGMDAAVVGLGTGEMMGGELMEELAG
jgi:hypothetical protein